MTYTTQFRKERCPEDLFKYTVSCPTPKFCAYFEAVSQKSKGDLSPVVSSNMELSPLG